jgi:hypothetical protein
MSNAVLNLYVRMVKNEISAWRDNKRITDTYPVHEIVSWMFALAAKGYAEAEISAIDSEYRKKAYEIIDKENSGSPQ